MTDDEDQATTSRRLRSLARRSEKLTGGQGDMAVYYERARWYVVVCVKPPRHRDRVARFAADTLDAAVLAAYRGVPL